MREHFGTLVGLELPGPALPAFPVWCLKEAESVSEQLAFIFESVWRTDKILKVWEK